MLQVQAHGSDAMVDEDNCVFFLPHRPRSDIFEPPFFLFMKGTGNWAFIRYMIKIVVHLKRFSHPITSLYFLNFAECVGWCGAGADHYEPLIAHASSLVSPEKVALVL